MTHKRNRKPYLITSEVAVILKCSVDEVRRLETDGEIVAVRTRAGTGISTPRPSRPIGAAGRRRTGSQSLGRPNPTARRGDPQLVGNRCLLSLTRFLMRRRRFWRWPRRRPRRRRRFRPRRFLTTPGFQC